MRMIRCVQVTVYVFVALVVSVAQIVGDPDTAERTNEFRRPVIRRLQVLHVPVVSIGTDGSLAGSGGYTALGQVLSDFDGDGDIDLQDYRAIRDCLVASGPGVPAPPGCAVSDWDGDTDIDLRDFFAFQNSFTGTNDSCRTPISVGDGTRSYHNLGATTDGPDDPACDFGFVDFGQVGADIWYCYTASCTGTAFVSLCGSEYDTKLAVYTGCACPTAPPLKCSDDDCGTGAGEDFTQSRVTFAATTGQKYLVRVGGYNGEQGEGKLTIGCNNVDACVNGSGDCFTPSPTPGCGDAACCGATCDVDQFCCDVTWDEHCVLEANFVCRDQFSACAAGAGPCNVVDDNEPGCEDVDCCNAVCSDDPYCCFTAWDSICVDEAASMCR